MQTANRPIHVVIHEPSVEGHHVGYLKFVTEDLLAAGYRLTLAIDTRPEPFARISAQMGDLLGRVTILPVRDEAGRMIGGGKTAAVASSLARSGADFVFLNNLDEIGSAIARRAALGLMPPKILRGRLGGIYHRPRFLGPSNGSPSLWLKAVGFRRLLQDGWFSHLLLVDPYLRDALKAREPTAPIFFLPDAFPADFATDRNEARRRFNLPDGKCIFLFYGGPYRRKGLDLAVAAMLAVPHEVPTMLLCAGEHVRDRGVVRGLEKLVEQGRALVIDRYVSVEEEKQLFAGSDVVLLPYRRHFGISGVLVRAVGAGLPVIVSDEELLGRLVREHHLGVLFPSGNIAALRDAIEQMSRAPRADLARWQVAARAWAPNCSRAAFGDALVNSFEHIAPAADLISVIVTTYNREDALDAVLRSLAHQTDRNFEVIVADDGSGQATAAVIEGWKGRFGNRLRRVWHTDRGFRAAEIRNRAIAVARGGYCIFLDGDCITRPDFVATHRRLARRGWFVTGNRILLSSGLTQKVLREKLLPEEWSLNEWLAQRKQGEINRLSALLNLHLGPLRYLRRWTWQGARSCNLAVWRTDLDRVDGFDADYAGWGKEDSDILVRLLRTGVRRKDGTFATGVLHLWHQSADRSALTENERKLDESLAGDRTRAKRGLSTLAREEAPRSPQAVNQ